MNNKSKCLLAAAILLTGCSTTQPHHESAYKQAEAPPPFSSFVDDARAALVDPEESDAYLAAKRNADRVDQFGKPKRNLTDQHITNWGRSVGGSLAGRYVDPARLFPVNQSFRPEHPNQVTYIMPNNTIVTTFARLPGEVILQLSETRLDESYSHSSASIYSAVISPPDPVEIRSEEVSRVGKLIDAELKRQVDEQPGLGAIGTERSRVKPGTRDDAQTETHAPTTSLSGLHQVDLCRQAGQGTIRERYEIPHSEWETLIDKRRQPGSPYDISRNGQILPMRECTSGF